MPKKSKSRPSSLLMSNSKPLVTPLILSSVYVTKGPDDLDQIYEGKKTGYSYAREGHPNADLLARRIDDLEETFGGLIVSSGMAGISAAILGICAAGDHIIASDQLYGRTLRLYHDEVSRFGIEVDFTDTSRAKNVLDRIKKNTKLINVETVANPTLRVADLEGISKICRAHDILLVVDNTFTTPMAIKPSHFGADIIINSITKLLSGHSDVTLGYVSASKKQVREQIYRFAVTTGLTPSPFECWLAERGLATFELRFLRCQETASEIADWLENHPQVVEVIYPTKKNHCDKKNVKKLLGRNGCNIVSFKIADDRNVADKFTSLASEIPFAPTLGDVSTTLSHPASSSHRNLSKKQQSELGITEGFFRMSIGLEPPNNLMQILDKALTECGTNNSKNQKPSNIEINRVDSS